MSDRIYENIVKYSDLYSLTKNQIRNISNSTAKFINESIKNLLKAKKFYTIKQYETKMKNEKEKEKEKKSNISITLVFPTTDAYPNATVFNNSDFERLRLEINSLILYVKNIGNYYVKRPITISAFKGTKAIHNLRDTNNINVKLFRQMFEMLSSGYILVHKDLQKMCYNKKRFRFPKEEEFYYFFNQLRNVIDSKKYNKASKKLTYYQLENYRILGEILTSQKIFGRKINNDYFNESDNDHTYSHEVIRCLYYLIFKPLITSSRQVDGKEGKTYKTSCLNTDENLRFKQSYISEMINDNDFVDEYGTLFDLMAECNNNNPIFNYIQLFKSLLSKSKSKDEEYSKQPVSKDLFITTGNVEVINSQNVEEFSIFSNQNDDNPLYNAKLCVRQYLFVMYYNFINDVLKHVVEPSYKKKQSK